MTQQYEQQQKKNGAAIYVSPPYSIRYHGKLLWIVFSCASTGGGRMEWISTLFSSSVLYWIVNNASDLPRPSAYWLMLRHSVSVETQSPVSIFAYWILKEFLFLSFNFSHFFVLCIAFGDVNQLLSCPWIRPSGFSGPAWEGVACY